MPTYKTNEFQLCDPLDNTKRWHLDLSGVTTGTTIMSTPPASSGQIGMTGGGGFTESMIVLNAPNTLTSQTGVQPLFDVTGAGALTLAAGTYVFDCMLGLTSMSATSGNFAFDLKGAGTCVLSSARWHASGMDATTVGTPVAQTGAHVVAQSGTVLVAAVGTAAAVVITGVMRIGTGGTLIPSISLITAAAAVVGVNSWFRCRSIGSATVTSVGSWS